VGSSGKVSRDEVYKEGTEMEPRSRYLVFGLTVVLVLVAATFLLLRQLTITSADDANAQMSLNVKSPSGACDTAEQPTKCNVALGSRFTLAVAVDSLPPGGDYIGFQTQIDYGSLVYEPTALPAGELVWPDSGFPLRSTIVEGVVEHADMTAAFPPFPVSAHVGNIVEMALTCTATDSVHTIELVPYVEFDNPLGAGFMLADQSVVPAKPVDTLEINCSGAVPTPAALVGDVNCSGAVDSIDAALVLQLSAGLISSLACQDAGDVNESGAIDAIDAALILQFVAGLIDSL
jgi:hypothetical protein